MLAKIQGPAERGAGYQSITSVDSGFPSGLEEGRDSGMTPSEYRVERTFFQEKLNCVFLEISPGGGGRAATAAASFFAIWPCSLRDVKKLSRAINYVASEGSEAQRPPKLHITQPFACMTAQCQPKEPVKHCRLQGHATHARSCVAQQQLRGQQEVLRPSIALSETLSPIFATFLTRPLSLCTFPGLVMTLQLPHCRCHHWKQQHITMQTRFR